MANEDEELKKHEENKKVSKDFLFSRQRNYQSVFDLESPVVQEVLKDLANFCFADKTTFDLDARVHAALEGRREVYLRIRDHLDKTSQELWKRYTGLDL